jgi:hypothetical protein
MHTCPYMNSALSASYKLYINIISTVVQGIMLRSVTVPADDRSIPLLYPCSVQCTVQGSIIRSTVPGTYRCNLKCCTCVLGSLILIQVMLPAPHPVIQVRNTVVLYHTQMRYARVMCYNIIYSNSIIAYYAVPVRINYTPSRGAAFFRNAVGCILLLLCRCRYCIIQARAAKARYRKSGPLNRKPKVRFWCFDSVFA